MHFYTLSGFTTALPTVTIFTVPMNKQITIEVSNQELDAMEDYLVSKLDKATREEYRLILIELWGKLVSAFDANGNMIDDSDGAKPNSSF